MESTLPLQNDVASTPQEEMQEQTAQQPLAQAEPQTSEQPVAETPTDTTLPTSEPSVSEAENQTNQAADAPTTANTEPTESADSAADAPAAEKEPDEDYSALGREELVAKLKELLSLDVTMIKKRVTQVKTLFNAANKEVQRLALEAFLAEGGDKDAYQPQEDGVAQEFYTLFNEYRARRQQYQDELEATKQRNLEQKKQLLDELKTLIESEEPLKTIYDRFNAIQDKWNTIGEVPRTDSNDLWQRKHFLFEQFFKKVNLNKEMRMLDMKRNLEQKLALCEQAEEMIVDKSASKAYKTLQELREQWKAIGAVPAEQNDLIWERFNNAAQQISTRFREFSEQRRADLDKNLLAKQALIEKAQELTAQMPETSKAWNEVGAALDDLLKTWKTIGQVPHEKNEEIWSTFKGCIDEFFSHKKEYFSKLKSEQSDNYNKKVDLCIKAEAIAKRDDWRKATQELLQLQEEWKTIGSVSKKNADKVWLRFRAACDEFFARKAEHFSSMRSSEQENLAKKQELLAQLKEFSFGESKEENLNIIKDFQRKWMEIGFVPASEKDRLQKEFRDTINSHFERLKLSVQEAEKDAFRDRIRSAMGDAKFANNTRNEIQDKIEKIKSDILLWENNMGFLANSKQADLLKEEFEKKIKSARGQIALLEAKLKILNESVDDAAQKND